MSLLIYHWRRLLRFFSDKEKQKYKLMKIEELNKAKVPIVKIDKKLERFRGKVLFPEKLELANKMLANTKLPKLPSSK
jgi:uncharacterized pyridoxamine 5'-phosphate oxidase family protein